LYTLAYKTLVSLLARTKIWKIYDIFIDWLKRILESEAFKFYKKNVVENISNSTLWI
jgi:hypothetical protein